MKYTAVQILISELKNYLPSIHQQGLIDKFEQALQLEKQQIIDARKDGYESTYITCDIGCGPNLEIDGTHEDYYHFKFKK